VRVVKRVRRRGVHAPAEDARQDFARSPIPPARMQELTRRFSYDVTAAVVCPVVLSHPQYPARRCIDTAPERGSTK